MCHHELKVVHPVHLQQKLSHHTSGIEAYTLDALNVTTTYSAETFTFRLQIRSEH